MSIDPTKNIIVRRLEELKNKIKKDYHNTYGRIAINNINKLLKDKAILELGKKRKRLSLEGISEGYSIINSGVNCGKDKHEKMKLFSAKRMLELNYLPIFEVHIRISFVETLNPTGNICHKLYFILHAFNIKDKNLSSNETSKIYTEFINEKKEIEEKYSELFCYNYHEVKEEEEYKKYEQVYLIRKLIYDTFHDIPELVTLFWEFNPPTENNDEDDTKIPFSETDYKTKIVDVFGRKLNTKDNSDIMICECDNGNYNKIWETLKKLFPKNNVKFVQVSDRPIITLPFVENWVYSEETQKVDN